MTTDMMGEGEGELCVRRIKRFHGLYLYTIYEMK